MPDSGMLLLGGLSLIAGVGFILFPNPLLKLSASLNKTLATLDQLLMRHRYPIGILLFVASYVLFRLAVWIGQLRG